MTNCECDKCEYHRGEVEDIITDCFESQKREGQESIPINKIVYDEQAADYRIQILKEDVPKSEDWSIVFSALREKGIIIKGITSDRYEEFIYIWLDDLDGEED